MKNRELKFRFWNKRLKRFETDLALQDGRILDVTCPFWNLVEEEYDVLQYTGLKDANGKEIYEWDILQVDDFNCAVIFGSRGAWSLSDGCNWTDEYLIDNLHGIVVGNMLENKELFGPANEEERP